VAHESGSLRTVAKVRSSHVVGYEGYLGAVDPPLSDLPAAIDLTAGTLASMALLTPLLRTATCRTRTTDQPS